MTNKFRVTNKKDGSVTYHVEGNEQFVENMSVKVLDKISNYPIMHFETKKRDDYLTDKQKNNDTNFVKTNISKLSKHENKSTDNNRKYVKELVKPSGEVVHQESDDVTIGDAFKSDLENFSKELEQPQDTSFYHTGVKDKDGVKHYRCRYKCQYCDNVGNHYIPTLVDNVQCHNCDKDLPVESVESITGEEKDLNANWYVAGSYVPRVN